MLRILRAFAWMRWRTLVNSLERTSARDTLQRLSLAVEQIGPLLAAALFIPSAAALAVLAGYAGYALPAAGSRPTLAAELLRFVLLGVVALSVLGPLLLPATERTNAVRLLLLPIPRAALYAAQAAAALADPWILLAIPIALALPAGLAAGGAPAAALLSLAAGLLFLAALVGLSTLSALLLHLLMRDRRRGELLALVFVIVLPLVAILPGALLDDENGPGGPSQSSPGIERVPGWAWTAGGRAFGLLPSETYRRVLLRGVAGDAAAFAPLGLLALTAAGLHALGLAASARLLDSPGSTGPRRAAGRRAARMRRVPGLSAGASIVAINQIRTAMRTPRGRSILLSPLLIFGVVLVVMQATGGGANLGFVRLASGLGLAAFGAAVCLLSLLPFAMNQFAIDRAGLTLQFLSPLSDRDILVGKAAGNGLIAGVPALLCLLGALSLFPGGHPGLWLSIPPGFIATYLASAPAAAVLSAMFPRAVDLNSVSSRSNAHGLAGFLGLAAVVVSSVPPVLLVTVAAGLGHPGLAPLVLLGWCGVCAGLFRVLLPVAERVFHTRRESLALVA